MLEEYDFTLLDRALSRLSTAIGSDREAYRERLIGTLAIAGFVERNEFDAAANAVEPVPQVRERLARVHMTLANADDPSFEKVLAKILKIHWPVASELVQYFLTNDASHYQTLVRNGRRGARAALHDLPRADLRNAAASSAKFHRAHLKQGAPQKVRLNTALTQLAELYSEHSDPRVEWWQLPHSRGSRFIQFAFETFHPFAPAGLCSPSALAIAFRRVKDREHGL